MYSLLDRRFSVRASTVYVILFYPEYLSRHSINSVKCNKELIIKHQGSESNIHQCGCAPTVKFSVSHVLSSYMFLTLMVLLNRKWMEGLRRFAE